jgi:pyruvate formate lyase activating enzyme
VTGTCFNIQRYSVHDGPGIRTTVFLKGCPLSCTWCHNPEGLSRELELIVVQDRCVGCGACVEACPNPPVVNADGRAVTDRRSCLRCGSCVDVCVAGARRLVGQPMTVGELLTEIERDRAFYEESGGGVTFSGGEPFEQHEFLLACLRACRERGLHTAVDTSGHAPRDVILEAATLTDLFLYDLKLLDEARHQELVGVPLAPVLDNLRALDEAGAQIWIRFPLIPGVTDSMDNVNALGRRVASLRTRRVHLLPFHRMAADKYARIEREWEHAGLEDVSEDRVKEAAEALGAMGLDVRVGG